jgi:hypothetical protein
MTPLAFAHKYLGQTITARGGLGGECVDLADQWIAEAYGLAHVYKNAIDWASPSIPGLAWTGNQPLNAPRWGALVVFGPSTTIGTGADGHIALVLAADTMTILTADQNWGGRLVTLNLHPYTAVLGWLSRKG